MMAYKGFTVMAPTKLYKRSLFDDLKFEIGKIAEDAFIMIFLLAASASGSDGCQALRRIARIALPPKFPVLKNSM